MKKIALLLAVVTLQACGGAAASPPPPVDLARAQGFTDGLLADGGADALPPGPLFINVFDIPQPPAGNITHRHVAGFVYAVTGNHRLAIDGGPVLDIAPGHAGFVGANVNHSHINGDAAANDWWFISIRPSSLRTAVAAPGQKILYASDDVPASEITSAGGYAQALRAQALAAAGRSAAHRHSGPSIIYVLTGSLNVKIAGQQATGLAAGSGAYLPAGAIEQESNQGTGPATYLSYSVTPAGTPAVEDVDRVP